jgi:hypothetical protein
MTKKTLETAKTLGQHWDKASLKRQLSIDRNMAVLPVLTPAAENQIADGLVFLDRREPAIRVVWVTTPEGLFADLRKSMDASDWERIVNTVQLRAALNARDEFKAKDAIAKLLGLSPKLEAFILTLPKAQRDVLSNPPKSLPDAPIIVAAEFSRQMSATKIVLWLNAHTTRLEPGILCPDLKAAFFVRVALGKTIVCPCCDKPFKPERPDQEYCSIRCRERFRKRRQRARQTPTKSKRRKK